MATQDTEEPTPLDAKATGEHTEEAATTTYGAVLRAERKARGWNQSELAEKIGTSQQNVGHWEAGRTVPRIALHEKLLVLFGQDSPLAALPPRGSINLGATANWSRRYRDMLEQQYLADIRESSGLPEIDAEAVARAGLQVPDRIATGRALIRLTAAKLSESHAVQSDVTAPGFKHTRVDMIVGDLLVEFRLAVGRDLETGADNAFFTLETFARAIERIDRRMLGDAFQPRRKLLIIFGPADKYAGSEQADTVFRKSDLYDIDVAICPDVDRAVDHIEGLLKKK